MPHGDLTRRNNFKNIRDPKTFLFRLFPLQVLITSQTRGGAYYPATGIRKQIFVPSLSLTVTMYKKQFFWASIF